MTSLESLTPFFRPRSCAVIGASRKKGKVGNTIFANMLRSFKGPVYPVNPNARRVLGSKAYASVLDIPGEVDLAVIAVPARIVPEVMRECAEKGVRGAVIISSGFAETGNRALEEEVRRIARTTGPRVVGVNCLGILDTHSGVDMLFMPEEKIERPKKGDIAFISQSGAVGSTVLDMIAEQGIGISSFVSYGNATDVQDYERAEYLAVDPETKVVCAYMEGTKDGKMFLEHLKKATRINPVIVLKAGRTEAGRKAAASHTASMAGSDRVYDAAFREAGVIRAQDLQELFDMARVLSKQPLAKGDRILIVTNGGGFGVLAADEVERAGLKLAVLSKKSMRKLEKVLPEYANISNPLDLVGDAGPERYRAALEVALEDDNVDAVLCIGLFQTVSITPTVVDHVLWFSRKKKKPVVFCAAGSDYTRKHLKKLEDKGVPAFSFPERAVRALKALVEYGRINPEFDRIRGFKK